MKILVLLALLCVVSSFSMQSVVAGGYYARQHDSPRRFFSTSVRKVKRLSVCRRHLFGRELCCLHSVACDAPKSRPVFVQFSSNPSSCVFRAWECVVVLLIHSSSRIHPRRLKALQAEIRRSNADFISVSYGGIELQSVEGAKYAFKLPPQDPIEVECVAHSKQG